MYFDLFRERRSGYWVKGGGSAKVRVLVGSALESQKASLTSSWLILLTSTASSSRIRNMKVAEELFAKWDTQQTPLDYWCEEVFGLDGKRSEGQCTVRKVSDSEIALKKPNGVLITFRSPEGFVVEPCLAAHMKEAFQVHIRTPNRVAWVNLKPF